MNDVIKIKITKDAECPKCDHVFDHEIEHVLTPEEVIQSSMGEYIQNKIAAAAKTATVEQKKTNAIINTDLENQISESNKENEKLKDEYIRLMAKNRETEKMAKDADLRIEKTVSKKVAKSEEEIKLQIEEKYRSRMAQKDKKIDDLDKDLANTQNRLHQGSQQAQGEVAELGLEDYLENTFRMDIIEPVPKGDPGADVIQTVKNEFLHPVGKIVCESKDTKGYDTKWIGKIKKDQGIVAADFAVLITTAKPKGNPVNYQVIDGVFVIDYRLVEPVISMLRMMLIKVSFTKNANENIEIRTKRLWEHITSPVFKNLIENSIDTWQALYDEVGKEKIMMATKWKTRETMLDKILSNTAEVYAGMKMLVGGELEPVEALLELDAYEENLELKGVENE